MQEHLCIGTITLAWISGGEFELDGGTMFGVVPKVLWEKKIPCGPDNHIRLVNTLILLRTRTALLVIDTGIGNKLNEKQKRNYRVTEEWSVPAALAKIGVAREEVEGVILTHCDFDHAGGIVMLDKNGRQSLTFPRARHYVQKSEWEDVECTNRRSASSYFPENFVLLKESGLLELVEGQHEIIPGVQLLPTGGHTRGHQAVLVESQGECALHMGDILPNHAHFHPLWVTPFDNFPLDSVRAKEELIALGRERNAWFTFYHDPYVYACRLDKNGNISETHGGEGLQ